MLNWPSIRLLEVRLLMIRINGHGQSIVFTVQIIVQLKDVLLRIQILVLTLQVQQLATAKQDMVQVHAIRVPQVI